MVKSFSITFGAKLFGRIVTLLVFAFLARNTPLELFAELSFLWVVQNTSVPVLLFGANVILIVNPAKENYCNSLKVLAINGMIGLCGVSIVAPNFVGILLCSICLALTRLNVAVFRGSGRIMKAEVVEQFFYAVILMTVAILFVEGDILMCIYISAAAAAMLSSFLLLRDTSFTKSEVGEISLREFYHRGFSLFTTNLASYANYATFRIGCGMSGNMAFVGRVQPIFQIAQSTNIIANSFKLTAISETNFSLRSKTRFLTGMQYSILLVLAAFADVIVGVLYGEKFVEDIHLFRWLVVPMSLNVLSSVMVSSLILRNQHLLLRASSLFGLFANIGVTLYFLLVVENLFYAFLGAVVGISVTSLINVIGFAVLNREEWASILVLWRDYLLFLVLFTLCMFWVA